MITEYVLFDLPAGISREEVIDGMREVAPYWRDAEDLIRKTFIYDPEANQAGAFYLWHNREAAEAAHDDIWRQKLLDTYGSEPVIRYFDTPMVVDNMLEQTIESPQ